MQERDIYAQSIKCMLCGWYWYCSSDDKCFEGIRHSSLAGFDINSPDLGLDELGTYLKHRFADPTALSWERFEDLANDVFKARGYRTVQTARTKDGGADVLLLGAGDKVSAIVECKKYSKENTIGVALVRTLVGSAVYWDVKEAYLVTTTMFSSVARNYVTDFRTRGYAVNLIDCTEFLKYLEVYNRDLPDLNKLTPAKREEIIAANMERYRPLLTEKEPGE